MLLGKYMKEEQDLVNNYKTDNVQPPKKPGLFFTISHQTPQPVSLLLGHSLFCTGHRVHGETSMLWREKSKKYPGLKFDTFTSHFLNGKGLEFLQLYFRCRYFLSYTPALPLLGISNPLLY